MNKLDRIIVALDQMSLDEIDVFLKQKNNNLLYVKIGLELFVKYGPTIIDRIHNDYKKKIFLDLKFHDIPVTVAKAISSLKGLPIEFLTVHLSGGEAMLKAAVSEARNSLPGCKLLGVSFLTSLESNDLRELFGISNLDEAFIRLFKTASLAGIHGIVSSPLEVTLLRNHFPNLLSVTPGIRFEDEIKSNITQDQKRVMNPKEAFAAGADFLVIGRSLTKTSCFSDRIAYLSQ